MATTPNPPLFQPTFRRVAQQGRHDDTFAVISMLTGKATDLAGEARATLRLLFVQNDVRAIVPHPVVHPRPCRILNDVGMCVPGSGLEEAGVRRADQHRARLVQCAQIGLEAFCLRGISHRGLLGCEKRNCEQASKPCQASMQR